MTTVSRGEKEKQIPCRARNDKSSVAPRPCLYHLIGLNSLLSHIVGNVRQVAFIRAHSREFPPVGQKSLVSFQFQQIPFIAV